MSTMTMKEMAKAMGEIDFAMLTTRSDGGQLALCAPSAMQSAGIPFTR